MKQFKSHAIYAACAAFLCVRTVDAAIYFQGKEVLRDGKMVADMERLYWAPTPDKNDTDRIQGHLNVNVDDIVKSVILVFQVFDSKGKLMSSFSITPQKCGRHPCGYGWCRRRFPLCGVEAPHVNTDRWDENSECFKKGRIAWFYVDFPRDRNAQSMRLVNVVIDGKEVQYNVRYTANRLMRYNLKSPEIKHGTEAVLGDESSCEDWLPQKSTRNPDNSSTNMSAPVNSLAYKPGIITVAEVDGINWSFAVERRGAVIKSGEKEKPAIESWTEGEVTIPSTLGGFPVREIGDDAFRGCGAITALTIPDGVRRVGENAFRECHSIAAIEFPKSVVEIGREACWGMSGLSEARIDGNVAVLDGTFACCGNLQAVDLGNGVRQMTRKVFERCARLASVVLPEKLSLIDCGMFTYGTFSGCDSLREVYFLGPPPDIKNFGKDLNSIVLYSEKYSLEWERWLKAKALSGAEPFNPTELLGGENEVKNGAKQPNAANEMPESDENGLDDDENLVALLSLDVSPLVVLRSGFTGKAHKCKEHFDNFTAAIEEAKSVADEKRKTLDGMVRKMLEKQMGKAQSDGNTGLASSIMVALSAFPDEANDGGAPEVAKVFVARNRRLSQINDNLANSVLASAKTLFVRLEGEKKEWAKKGESDIAKNIADFQRELSAWVKEVKAKVSSTAPTMAESTSQP